jgi:hypothetical protein
VTRRFNPTIVTRVVAMIVCAFVLVVCFGPWGLLLAAPLAVMIGLAK